MSRIQLVGVDGSNPLGFLAALGLLRVVPGAKLGFSEDGSCRAFVDGLDKSESDLATLIAADAEASANASAPWRFTYTKAATKKKGPQEVADLKPPPDDFKKFLATCIEAWLMGNDEAAGYAAAYGTDIAVDGKGNTKPTAFHFTAANQTFLGAVESIRASVTQEWVETSLFKGHGAQPGSNVRWDPGSERNWALMANNPNDDGTRVDAPLEWLAFRGLPLLPSFPRAAKIITTAVLVRGHSGRVLLRCRPCAPCSILIGRATLVIVLNVVSLLFADP
ncbi:MAG: type I-G CRISPR-associated protein, Cas3-extension family [Gammaproteobacteria bacterium]